MKKGYVLLEVVIGVAIFSSLMLVMSSTFLQLSRSLNYVTRMFDDDTRSMIVQDLMEKDMAGVFLPELIVIKKSDEEKKTANVVQKPEDKEVEKKKAITLLSLFFSPIVFLILVVFLVDDRRTAISTGTIVRAQTTTWADRLFCFYFFLFVHTK